MVVENKLFHYFIRDSLREYSESFRFLRRGMPFTFSLNGIKFSIHISSIHFARRNNPDEYRIQVDRQEFEVLRQLQEDGHVVAFVGVFEGNEAFVGWEPQYGFSLTGEQRVSLYCRFSQLALVKENLSATHKIRSVNLGRSTDAIALPTSALGFYLENIEQFHRLPTEAAITKLIDTHTVTFSDFGFGTDGEFDIEDDDGHREKFTYERKAYPRDPRFKKWVLDAYQQTCCVCDRQLSIIQAAHIIPHSEDDSPNNVQNGLALCIEHHRLYDDALLLPGPEQKLVFNRERAEYLRQTEQQKGLDGIEAFSGKQYQIPIADGLRPCDEYLKRGLAIRMDG